MKNVGAPYPTSSSFEEVENSFECNIHIFRCGSWRRDKAYAFRKGKLDRHMVRGLCFHWAGETCEGLF